MLRVGHMNVLILRLVSCPLSMFFLNLHYTISKHELLDYLKQVVFQVLLKTFVIPEFVTNCFCLGKMHGVLVNNEYSY